MITHLRGTLVAKAPTQAVLDLGGVGYGLAISLITYDRLPPLDEEVHLFTHLHVREDRMDLFGFADAEEREVFELLIGVSGIGPNSALTVLSGMTLRKTAERLVLDLRDKVRISASATDESATGAEVDAGPSEEAALALMTLGYAAPAARQAVRKAIDKYGADLSVQQLIKQALKER